MRVVGYMSALLALLLGLGRAPASSIRKQAVGVAEGVKRNG